MIKGWNRVKNLELNPINLIQPLGTLPVKLTETHTYKSNLNSLLDEKIKQSKYIIRI